MFCWMMDLYLIKFVTTASYLNHYLSPRHVASVLTFGTNIDNSQEQPRNHLIGRGVSREPPPLGYKVIRFRSSCGTKASESGKDILKATG
jgi:hypothetical protein